MIRSGEGDFPETRETLHAIQKSRKTKELYGVTAFCEMTQNDRVEIGGFTSPAVLSSRGCNKCYLLRFLLLSREPTVIAEWPPSIGILKSCIGGPIEVDEIEGFLTETPM
jgi:hypothetical protein